MRLDDSLAHACVRFDPFDPDFKRDPHATYRHLREHAPVHRVRNQDGRTMYLVTRHEDVLRVLKDPRFVKNGLSAMSAEQLRRLPPLPPATRYLMAHMLAADPPVHTRLRALVRMALSPRLIEGLRPRIQQIADDLLAPMLARGRMELIDDYAFPLPITVIAELLGLPREDHALLRRWSEVLITNTGRLDAEAFARTVPVLEELAAYLRRLFAAKRSHPGNDLTTELLRAEAAGDRLSEDELIAMILLLVLAGHETTVNLIGNAVLALLRHPAQLALLRSDPTLIPDAVEEFLRYDGPVETSTLRYACEDLELAGVPIRKGEIVLVVLSSANRDPALIERPDTLDVTRAPRPHLAFGHSIHYCIGASLARIEAAIALETLLRRVPSFQLASDPEQLEWRLGLLIRGLRKLPIVFTRESM